LAPYHLNKGLEETLTVTRNVYRYDAELLREFGDLPEVYCVPDQINQVLLNLIANAAQALRGAQFPAGRQGRIRIATGRTEDAVYCEVEDNGDGVPPEAVPHIFDPFFTTKAPGEGTGLGLSISYDIVVNKHGGTLAYNPAPGGGACFRMTLPLTRPRPERSG
jgi:signal transduction histidine kinase